MPYQSGQVSVGTTATLVCSVGSAPDTDGVLINSSAAAFIGGSGVTASTGFPVIANTPVLVADDGHRTAGLRRCSACPRPQLAVVAHFCQVAGHLGVHVRLRLSRPLAAASSRLLGPPPDPG
jgi:hypothetical protein